MRLPAFVATNAEQVDFTPYIKSNVLTRMYGSNSTVYVRIPFTVADVGAVDALQLLMRYDDGFVAYLNGHLIASANAPCHARVELRGDAAPPGSTGGAVAVLRRQLPAGPIFSPATTCSPSRA